MDPISAKNALAGEAGNNPINNPRIDLLHNSGDNQQLAGAAGSYGPEKMFTPAPLRPAPAAPRPQPSQAPQSANSYVAAAVSKKPAAPVPIPEPAPAPRPSHADLPAESVHQPSRRPLLIGIFVVVLLVLVAGGVYWWLNHRSNSSSTAGQQGAALTPVTPTQLVQKGSEVLSQGSSTNSKQITFTFSLPTTAGSGSATPQIELEPTGTPFTGTPTTSGTAVSANGGTLTLTVTSAALADGAYHWQARDSVGSQHSAWAVFGGDASATAFTVDTQAPAAPTVSTIGGAAVANPTVVSSNQPTVAGTAEPNASIKVAVSPDSQTFTATADASGNWSVTPGSSIPNGQHQLSITATDAAGNTSTATAVALSINPATAAQTTPVSGATGAPTTGSSASAGSSSSSTSGQPASVSNHLANTGDNTDVIGVLSLAAMVMAAGGLMWIRRRYAVR